jgi:hypothetical protein
LRLAIAGTTSISPPAVTPGWLARICSTRLEPERNMPQMKIRRGASAAGGSAGGATGKAAISRST